MPLLVAAVLGERDRRLEQLLHLERRADLDADLGRVVTGVLERVDLAGRDGDDIAGTGDDLLRPMRKAIVPSRISKRSS